MAKSHSYWNKRFKKAGFYIKGNKKAELVSGSKYKKLSRKGKKKLFEKLTRKHGNRWPSPPKPPGGYRPAVLNTAKKLTTQANTSGASKYARGQGMKFGTGHSDGWDWMDIKKKSQAKDVNWGKRYKEAGFYIPGNGRAEAISSDKWKKMDYEDKWKRYGELTGMTRFSDIGKKNWDDINWEAKFKDRPGAWESIAPHWHKMDAQDKWSAYSRLKGEIPDDYDDVFGKEAEDDLKDLKEADGKMPSFADHQFGDIEYSQWNPNKDDHEIFKPDGKRGGAELKAKYTPSKIMDIESAISAASGKSPEHIEGETLTVQQQAAKAAMDKAGTGAWQAPVTPTGPPGTNPPLIQPDPEQWSDTYDAPANKDFTKKPAFTKLAEDSDVGITAPTGDNKDVQDKASDVYDEHKVNPAELIAADDPRKPGTAPQPDATAWQGAGATAKREGLEKDYTAYDPGRTATPGLITSAMGSKLARSEASRTGRNTMGTGAFKYRNPLTINNEDAIPSRPTKGGPSGSSGGESIDWSRVKPAYSGPRRRFKGGRSGSAGGKSLARVREKASYAIGSVDDPNRRPDLSRPAGFYNPRKNVKYARPDTKPAWAN